MARRYRYQTIEIEQTEITLRVLRDPSQFSDDQAFALFGIIWASSEVLSALMLKVDIDGKRILEIGCGMALVSHVLNARGADITAMDIHPVPGELLQNNTELNKTNPIPFQNASWADELPDLGKFDLIVGSDILYEPRQVETLPAFIDRHAKTNSEVVIVDPDRGQFDVFQNAMSAFGFACDSYKPEFSDHLDIPYRGTVYNYSR